MAKPKVQSRLNVGEHEILQDNFNLIVRHPLGRRQCSGRTTTDASRAKVRETYFTQSKNVLWELKDCCKVPLSAQEQSKILTLKGSCE